MEPTFFQKIRDWFAGHAEEHGAKKLLIAAAVVAVTLFFVVTSAFASPTGGNCAPTEAVHARLADGYGETPQGAGLASSGALVTVFVNEETGSWIVTVTASGGPACLVASGHAWTSNPAAFNLDPAA